MSSNVKNSFINSLFIILCNIVLLPERIFAEPNCNLDESWRLAINIALRDGLIFGKDFVFTYGPLGFIATRETFSLNIFTYLFFDVLNIICISNTLWIILNSFSGWLKYIFIFLSVLVCTLWSSYVSEDLPVLYFVIILFQFFHFFKHKNYFPLVQIAALGLIGTFIKVNFGLIYSFSVLFIGSSLFLSKKLSFKEVTVFLLGYFVSLFLLSKLLNTDLISYFINSLPIIDGYNDMMYSIPELDTGIYYVIYALTVDCVFIFSLFVSIRLILENKKSFLTNVLPNISGLILLLGIFYVLFKQTVVNGHTFEFPKFLPMLAGVFYLALNNKQVRLKTFYSYAMGIFLFVSISYSFIIHKKYFNSNEVFDNINPSFLIKKTGKWLGYAKEFKKKKKFQHSTACVYFPDDVKKMVGNGTVDIIPWEISAVETNKMKYSPRPVIQSYSTYHHELDLLNAEKYKSANGPDFVFFQLHSLGDRNLLHEEVYTKLALYTNYELAEKTVPDFFGSYLIFKKRKQPITYELGKDSMFQIEINKSFKVPENVGLELLTIDFDYSILGKLKRFLYMPPPVKMVITLENGSDREFRLVKPVVTHGIIGNIWIDYMQNTPEIEAFFKFQSKYNKKIISYKIICSEEWGIKKSFTAKWNQIKFKNQISPNYPLNTTKVYEGNINGGLDWVDTFSSAQVIKGWAYKANQYGCCNQINILAKGENGTYTIPTLLNVRYDIAQKNNLPFTYINSGFSGIVIKEGLPKGAYNLQLEVIDYESKKSIVNTGLKLNAQN